MKVVQLISNIQAESDGVSNCVKHLSLALNPEVTLEVQSLKANGELPSGFNIRLYETMSLPTLLKPLNKLGLSPEMGQGLKNVAESIDILHIHSLWMMQNYYAYEAVKNKNVKLCIHIHGTLSPWALQRSRLKKKISLWFLKQRKALERADLLIASCEEEYRDIRNFGLKNPVAIITNGIDYPNLNTFDVRKNKTVVFLSRIHPKKGIDVLLKSWKSIQERFPDWDLKIAGNNNSDYGNQLKTLCESEGLRRVTFTGEIKGKDKYQFLADAALFVLPTYSENFGIAVGEALACGTPVITTTGAPWSGLVDNDCGLWIDLSVDNLTKALEDMMSRPMEQLISMGENGRNWIKRDFAWDEIAKKTIKSYEWLLAPDKVEKPDWIYID